LFFLLSVNCWRPGFSRRYKYWISSSLLLIPALPCSTSRFPQSIVLKSSSFSRSLLVLVTMELSHFCFALGLLCVWVLYKLLTRISVSDVPGPEPESFLLGELEILAVVPLTHALAHAFWASSRKPAPDDPVSSGGSMSVCDRALLNTLVSFGQLLIYLLVSFSFSAQ
jgi:hypothetical protein